MSRRNAAPDPVAGPMTSRAASADLERDARCKTTFLMSGRRRSPAPRIAMIRCVRAPAIPTPKALDPDFRADESTVRADESTVRADESTVRSDESTVRSDDSTGAPRRLHRPERRLRCPQR